MARWVGIDPANVVVISEYTGGGFGSKITGAISLVIPVLLAKKANAPVMMRVSREEEHYIGRGRPGVRGRMKVGFSKEGRITALDMFSIGDNGPYERQGDVGNTGIVASLMYQPLAMRFRGISVLTRCREAPRVNRAACRRSPSWSRSSQRRPASSASIRYIRRLNAPVGKRCSDRRLGP